MATLLDDDDNLTIQLLSYHRPTEQTEDYYFLEMSTLQATTLLAPGEKIVTCKMFAYMPNNQHLEEHVTAGFKTVGDFNDFFLNNPAYYIHDCDLELENGMQLWSHDDGRSLHSVSCKSCCFNNYR